MSGWAGTGVLFFRIALRAASASTDRVLSDHNGLVERRALSWTAASRKHRITRDQVQTVLAGSTTVLVRPADPPLRPDEALLFLGTDADGLLVEVVGVELDDGRLRIIHAMPMRAAYQCLHRGDEGGGQ